MVSSIQSQTLSGETNPLHNKVDAEGSARLSSTPLIARLPIPTQQATCQLLDPRDISTTLADVEGSFILAHDTVQREDGLTVAMVGEPGIAVDYSSGEILHIDASQVLDLYEAGGVECLNQIHGSWALVLVDVPRKRLVLACDRMARQPLYYRVENDYVLVGNCLSNLGVCGGKTGIDSQSLYHYFYFHMIPAPDSVLTGFKKLASASVLELSTEGATSRRYWTPSFNEHLNVAVPSLFDELRRQIKDAVARCATNNRNLADDNAIESGKEVRGVNTSVGAFLSGGLDSTTVAGMLSEIQGGSCKAYAIGFDAEGYDEMPFARLAAQHFGIQLREHYVTPDEVVQAIPSIAAASGEPFGNSSVLPAYFCAKTAAADNIEILLAGDGGDELFAGNERYAYQQIFESYRRIPNFLRSKLVEPLVRSLPAKFPLASKAQSFLIQANIPLPDRLQYYSFLEQNSPDDVFTPQFLNCVDRNQPLQLLNEIYRQPVQASELNRMLYLDWQITLADNDLRKVNQACSMAGVVVRYPMLDDRLVEFSTRIPSDLKLPRNGTKNRRLRDFFKKGLTGWLPDETINKSKHGFGLPFGVWMKTHKPLQELAYDSILRLQQRGIFSSRFLEKAVASHREGHAAYYGELIWVLMCLELWLNAKEPDYQLG